MSGCGSVARPRGPVPFRLHISRQVSGAFRWHDQLGGSVRTDARAAVGETWPLLTSPLLVVEIVGTGHERELAARSSDYHRGGAEALWILDVRVPMLEIYERTSNGWSTLTVLTEQNHSARVPLPGGSDVLVSRPPLLS